MNNIYFVTGTDTDVGKTVATLALMQAATKKSLSSYALKPVAAGCESTDQGLRNQDALLLQKYASVKLPYAQINPLALREAVAPHIAALNEERTLSVGRLEGFCRGALLNKADLKFIEGAGGWRVPLNAQAFMSDLPKALKLPVILVVGIKLGCLNHALLTAEIIARDGLRIAGWIANNVDPDCQYKEENIKTLQHSLPFPFIGRIPWSKDCDIEHLAQGLDVSVLL